ncbi:MAG: hypothetical protein JWN34_2681 [Bryobacterales bacterium]|nr:hypothetical protein [Bryobacterales bacterium]
MRFDWLRLKFEFTAMERVEFPPVIAANVLRGALGIVSRGLACTADCPGAALCPRRAQCLYARVFEPAPPADLPSGLAHLPRPFVFRARHLDGRMIVPGEEFSFDLHLFSSDPEIARHIRRTFEELEQHGLGPTRGRVKLRTMTSEAQTLPLHGDSSVDRVTVSFLTPTELKSGGRLAATPKFAALFGRIRDRVSVLRALYGGGPLAVDFRAIGERAESIRMKSWMLEQQHTLTRYSTRTGQTHPLGGFTGTAVYEGELGEFLPWLLAAQATGVGRQAVWGKGEISVAATTEP